MSAFVVNGRYVAISSDGHAGADRMGYRPYLSSRWHDEFDRWAGSYRSPFVEAKGTQDGPDRLDDPGLGVDEFRVAWTLAEVHHIDPPAMRLRVKAIDASDRSQRRLASRAECRLPELVGELVEV